MKYPQLISLLIITIFLMTISHANASLVSIHTPKKGATVPIGPLLVTGRAIQSNSTLKDCSVQVRMDKLMYLNVTGVSKSNFSSWHIISNQTSPGLNTVEAQLICVKTDGTFLTKHNTHNFTVSAPPPSAVLNATLPPHANLTNQLTPPGLQMSTPSNVSTPITTADKNVNSTTGDFLPALNKTSIHNNATQTLPSHINATVTNSTPPLTPKANDNISKPNTQQTAPMQSTTTPTKPHQQGLSILTMPHISGHHKIIHIHLSH